MRYKLYENGIISAYSGHKRILPKRKDGEEKLERKKTYTISRSVYRKLVSSCVNLYVGKVNQVIFFTLTFPLIGGENGNSGTPTGVYDYFANSAVSNFLENLKKNYKLNAYVGVKEYHKSGIPHYHFLFDIPFVDIKKVNAAWCAAYIGCASAVGIDLAFSNSAVRLPAGKNRAVVKSLGGIVRYLGKYISKSRGDGRASDTRIYFVSRNVCSRPRDVNHDMFLALTGTFQSRIIKHEYNSTVIMEKVVFPNFDERKIKKLNEILDQIIEKEKMIAVAENYIKQYEEKKRQKELDIVDLRAQYDIVLSSVNVIEPVEIKQRYKQKTTRA